MATLDEVFIRGAEAAADIVSICSGTCAVAAFVELPEPHGKEEAKVTVANLGDSRVVCGKFKSSLFVEALSEDHSIVSSASERKRLKQQFPHVEEITVLGDGEMEEHGTVMGLCRFTRSIGDCHMKSATSAEAFNRWHGMHGTGLSIKPPDPGTPDAEWTAAGGSIPGMYISNSPDIRETAIQDGFLIIACDGIWDEMDNNEAAQLCARLLVENQHDPDANVAKLFVDEAMRLATKRIRREYDDEAELTYEELLRRRPGKHEGGRSLLHDDMTVIIIDIVRKDQPGARARALRSVDTATSPTPKVAPKLGKPRRQKPSGREKRRGSVRVYDHDIVGHQFRSPHHIPTVG
jgi:serine/threonine protein phosphatase PrpC